jgi:hypothetical protein
VTPTIMKLIDVGIIRNITISQNWRSVELPPNSSIQEIKEPKYKVSVRWEWATDAISYFDTSEELDKKLLWDVKQAGERYQDFVRKAKELHSDLFMKAGE